MSIWEREMIFKDWQHLEELLLLNKVINAILIPKDKLKHIWTYRAKTCTEKAIDECYYLARAVNYPAVKKFSKILKLYRHRMLNHCDYPIHTGEARGGY